MNFVSEEYNDFLYKILKSKATVICSGEPIYEENTDFDLIFPEFNQYFVGAMSTIDNIRSNDNRKYMFNIISKIGGKDAVNFIKEEKSFRKEDWDEFVINSCGMLIDFDEKTLKGL